MTLSQPLAHVARIQVRTATGADLPTLVELWEELREAGGRPAREVMSVPADEVEERLQHVLHDDTCRLIVATLDHEIQGMAVLSPSHYGPLSGFRAVQLNHIVVGRRHRRRGVGRALVAAAAAFAEEIGADHVAVSVAPGLREPNRFYARLGFSPMVVRRVAPVAVLRRRLTTGEHPVAALEELTRRRLVARPLLNGRPRLRARR